MSTILAANLLLRLALSKLQQQIYCWDWQCQNCSSKFIAETGSVKIAAANLLLRLAVSKSSSKCIAETGSVKIQQQMYC
jgi:hypothetical protein